MEYLKTRIDVIAPLLNEGGRGQKNQMLHLDSNPETIGYKTLVSQFAAIGRSTISVLDEDTD